MIRLTQLNIAFRNKKVITGGSLEIRRGEVTALTGPSGSGKTTLLYCVGLISSNKNYVYRFEGKEIDLSNDAEKAAYRKNRIGYVFQENSLIETMSVRDNLLTSLGIAEDGKAEEKLSSLLRLVGLSGKEALYPRQLSGGERQRAAIACALIKDPDLIIADEPTSALDEGNANAVFGLLQKIAHEQNRMVVLASHDPNIYGRADRIYRIADRTTVLEEPENEGGAQEKEAAKKPLRKRLPFGFYLRCMRTNNRRSRMRRYLITLLCALAVSFISLCVDFGDNFVSGQEELMNRISDREIFVVNATPSQRSFAVHRGSDYAFEPDMMTRILKSIGVSRVIPYVELGGVSIDGKELPFFVCPYYEEQLMDEKSDRRDQAVAEENGVYLSYPVARELGIEKPENCMLEITFLVPEKIRVVKDDSGIPFELSVTGEETLRVPVRGILEASIDNTYSESGNSIVFLPYRKVEELLEKHKASEFEKDEKEWSPNACWAVAYTYTDVKPARDGIRELSDTILAYNRYQDFEAMIAGIRETRTVMTIISAAIFVIIFLMVTVIRIHETDRRKYEICILKANGLRRAEIYLQVLTESLAEMLKIFVCSLLLSCLLAFVTNDLIFGQKLILLNAKLAGVLALISLASIIVPSIVTLFFTNRYEPDRLIRGK